MTNPQDSDAGLAALLDDLIARLAYLCERLGCRDSAGPRAPRHDAMLLHLHGVRRQLDQLIDIAERRRRNL